MGKNTNWCNVTVNKVWGRRALKDSGEVGLFWEFLHGVSRCCWISPIQSPLCFGAFWAGPGCAVPCRARSVEERNETSLSGEFRFAECDGQLQVLLFLLGEPGQSLLFLSLALPLCPLDHIFLCWILLHQRRKNRHKSHKRDRERTVRMKRDTKTDTCKVNRFEKLRKRCVLRWQISKMVDTWMI